MPRQGLPPNLTAAFCDLDLLTHEVDVFHALAARQFALKSFHSFVKYRRHTKNLKLHLSIISRFPYMAVDARAVPDSGSGLNLAFCPNPIWPDFSRICKMSR